MFGLKVPIPHKEGLPKVDFEVLRSGGAAVTVRFGKLRGRVSWTKKRGFNISTGVKVPNPKTKGEGKEPKVEKE